MACDTGLPAAVSFIDGSVLNLYCGLLCCLFLPESISMMRPSDKIAYPACDIERFVLISLIDRFLVREQANDAPAQQTHC
jgi:hypothetical protein